MADAIDGGKLDLAVVITSHNSVRSIERCIKSVAGLAREVHVVDSGSTDATVQVCEALGARVVHRVWTGYASQKSFAISLGQSCAWTLLLDSDESLEPSLQEGLREAIVTAAPSTRAIAINRKMWYVGGWINHVGFPDWVVRCGRPGALSIEDRPVHERVDADGIVVRARGVCRHESWNGVCDALERSAKYARLSAQIRSPAKFPVVYACFSVAAIILKNGVLRLGFLDGWRGCVAIAVMAAGRFAATMAAYERSRARD